MPARILVIEDTPDNLDLMCYLLGTGGHQLLTAADGESGVGAVRREAPDLVICDVHLPGMGGLDVARELKQDANYSSIPLIAVTALAMVGDRDRILSAGFDGYISKPIDPEMFVAQVESYLRRV